MRDTWQFMTSVMTSVVFVPMMGALFTRPRPAAGLCAAAAGLVGLVVFYVLVFTLGARDNLHEKHVWIVAGVEVGQDYAALCALPVSLVGFMFGNRFGRPAP
jgi:predicted membrane protein